MRPRSKIVVPVAMVVCAVGLLAWLDSLESRERAEEGALDRTAHVSAPPSRRQADDAADADDGPGGESMRGALLRALGSESAATASPPPARRILYLNDIDDIKHEIYAREIESVDRLHLLDDLVQTGDRDTRELWNRDWSGADDWKTEQNGFTLQRTEDGSLIFHPDQATMALYTFYETLQAYEYDAATGEFVNEVDYYGKPIRNVLKFINEDTLVMMTISGEKVDLDIYGEGAPQE